MEGASLSALIVLPQSLQTRHPHVVDMLCAVPAAPATAAVPAPPEEVEV